MPDTPRTVREWMDGLDVADGIPLAGYFPEAFLDALIGCQDRVVYTAEDVEAAVDAVARVRFDPERAGRHMSDYLRAVTVTAITAAGGVVADEVVEIGHYLSIPLADGSVHADPGDILYIVRAKEE